MNSSDKITDLAKALAVAQAEMEIASKTATNPHFKSKYAPLPEVFEVAKKALHKNGLCFVQPTYHHELGVGIETILIHSESGQWLSGDLVLTPQQNTPQGIGSAITYGRRFGLCSLVGIVADEDDDGAAASTEKPKMLSVKDDKPAKAKGAPTNDPAIKAVNSPGAAKPDVFDPVATEKRMHLELLAGFDSWDEKRGWRERNKADKDLLSPEAQLRVSNAYVGAEPTAKNKSGQAP